MMMFQDCPRKKHIKVILTDFRGYWDSKYVRKSESHIVFKDMSL